MQQSNNYIADHFSILLVKEHFGMDVKKELEVYRKAIVKIGISGSHISALYIINKRMFPLHDIIMNPEIQDKKVAELSRELLKLNGQRVKARSEVAKEYGEFTEYKTYAS